MLERHEADRDPTLEYWDGFQREIDAIIRAFEDVDASELARDLMLVVYKTIDDLCMNDGVYDRYEGTE